MYLDAVTTAAGTGKNETIAISTGTNRSTFVSLHIKAGMRLAIFEDRVHPHAKAGDDATFAQDE